MTTFIIEMRKRLDKELSNKQFTAGEFTDLAEKHGKNRKAIIGTLRRFEIAGLIEVIKTTRTITGGFPSNTYRVVKGASFIVVNSSEKVNAWRKKVKTEEEQMASCCRRLEKVMAGWARV